MALKHITAGDNVPDEINVIIEIPLNREPVKYEVDKDTHAMFVDRFLSTSMHYPCNYGYVPDTLCGDGDPIDVCVVAPLPVISGSIIRCRPLGVLLMEDDGGEDQKIVAVPTDKLTARYQDVSTIRDLPLQPEHRTSLQQALFDVTHAGRGTATHIFEGFPVPAAGKTGTAEDPPRTSHAWFAGYAPAGPYTRPDGTVTNEPEIAVVVIAENAGEGSAATS